MYPFPPVGCIYTHIHRCVALSAAETFASTHWPGASEWLKTTTASLVEAANSTVLSGALEGPVVDQQPQPQQQ